MCVWDNITQHNSVAVHNTLVMFFTCVITLDYILFWFVNVKKSQGEPHWARNN